MLSQVAGIQGNLRLQIPICQLHAEAERQRFHRLQCSPKGQPPSCCESCASLSLHLIKADKCRHVGPYAARLLATSCLQQQASRPCPRALFRAKIDRGPGHAMQSQLCTAPTRLTHECDSWLDMSLVQSSSCSSTRVGGGCTSEAAVMVSLAQGRGSMLSQARDRAMWL